MPELYSSNDKSDSHHTSERKAHSEITVRPNIRKYKHFDLPLTTKREWVFDFSIEKNKHRFYPLIGFDITHRRFDLDPKTNRKKQRQKLRPIRFASHSDALYLQAYAEYLHRYYEHFIKVNNLSESIRAYRECIGNNIHHARDLFSEISQKKDCSFLAIDIRSFFDKIDHKILYSEIKNLLKIDRLEKHDYTVWRNITKYSYVEKKDIIDKLKAEYKKLDPKITQKQIKDRITKNKRICTKSEFISLVRGRNNNMIKINENSHGIPQGTPISGLYANIYLKSFDLSMLEYCNKIGGSYRRYSDDIALVFPVCVPKEDVSSKIEELLEMVRLSIAKNKTETATFQEGRLQKDSPRPFIQYLGFTFDGDRILIRASTQHAYLRKMRRGIHAKMIAFKHNPKKTISEKKEPFKREVLSRYTHLGKRRNFLRYAHKASKIMESPDIKKQFKRHMTWFKRSWRKEIKKVLNIST